GSAITGALMPMTGVAFILFTFYMVTDPATTPNEPRAQLVFGASVAAVYGLLMGLHIVFGLFFALTIVCAIRGVTMCAHALARRRRPVAQELAPARAVVEEALSLNGHKPREAEAASVAAGKEA